MGAPPSEVGEVFETETGNGELRVIPAVVASWMGFPIVRQERPDLPGLTILERESSCVK